MKNVKIYIFEDQQGERETILAVDEQTAWDRLAENYGYNTTAELRYGIGIRLTETKEVA